MRKIWTTNKQIKKRFQENNCLIPTLTISGSTLFSTILSIFYFRNKLKKNFKSGNYNKKYSMKNNSFYRLNNNSCVYLIA